MKASNIFIIVLGIIVLTGMYVTNVILKNEYQKIDVNDPYKNYVSVNSEPYSVLDISGSNGYPIEIIQKETNAIKVLRSRLQHFKSNVKNDTLFIQFTGSNISMKQSFLSTTPSGIIINKDKLSSIHVSDTHNRINGYSNQNLKIALKGSSYVEVSNFHLNNLMIEMENNSQIDFTAKNTVDSLSLKMKNTSVASLQKVDFNSINHKLNDSITLVLSKGVFNNLLKHK